MSVLTTNDNPLVTIWDVAVSETYDSCVGEIRTGMLGSMNLTTASEIHDFNITGVAEQLIKLGTSKRIKVSDKQWAKNGTGVYLELHDRHEAEVKKDAKWVRLEAWNPSPEALLEAKYA